MFSGRLLDGAGHSTGVLTSQAAEARQAGWQLIAEFVDFDHDGDADVQLHPLPSQRTPSTKLITTTLTSEEALRQPFVSVPVDMMGTGQPLMVVAQGWMLWPETRGATDLAGAELFLNVPMVVGTKLFSWSETEPITEPPSLPQ
jgi:hypothetical protein